jgi:hypothetical protein
MSITRFKVTCCTTSKPSPFRVDRHQALILSTNLPTNGPLSSRTGSTVTDVQFTLGHVHTRLPGNTVIGSGTGLSCLDH